MQLSRTLPRAPRSAIALPRAAMETRALPMPMNTPQEVARRRLVNVVLLIYLLKTHLFSR